jgi:hypothetical protein
MLADRRVKIDEELFERVVVGEVCLKMGRVTSVAEYLAKRAMVRGIKLAVGYDRTVIGRTVHLAVTFRLLESLLDAKETKRYLVARARALAHYLGSIVKLLDREGIKCKLETQIQIGPLPNPSYAGVLATFTIESVDADTLLGKKNIRQLIFWELRRTFGGEKSSFIKLLEELAEGELERERERGAGDTYFEEAAGEAGEGGAEGVLHGAGAGGEGAAEVLGAAGGGGAGEGWIRVIDAVAEFEVPLAHLLALIKEGRIEGRVGPDGFWYVRLEDVMKIREAMGKGGRVRGGGA